MRADLVETELKAISLCLVLFWLGADSRLVLGKHAPAFHASCTRVELGRVSAGTKQPVVIEIGNSGDETLVIHSVTSNCGCLSPAKQWKDVQIQPAEMREVQFYLMVESKGSGRTAKTILFKTNDPVQPYWPIVVAYTVKRDYRVVAFPAKLDFGRIASDRGGRAMLTLISPYPEPIKVHSIISADPSIRIERVASNALGDVLRYSVEFPPGCEPGSIGSYIDVETMIGSVRIPVTGWKVGRIECTPVKITFPPAGQNGYAAACLMVSSPTGEGFRVLGATPETDDIRIDLVGDSEQPAATHKVWLRLSAAGGPPNIGQSRIRLDTDTLGSLHVDCSYFVHQHSQVQSDEERPPLKTENVVALQRSR